MEHLLISFRYYNFVIRSDKFSFSKFGLKYHS